jgi:hypothetical protein
MKLTPEQQQALRIAVAEIAGWKYIQWDKNWRGGSIEPKWLWIAPGQLSPLPNLQVVPNYPADLNAVYEVEMTLGRGLLTEPYLKHLLEIIPSQLWSDVVLASATDRCIALVMTLAPDKWETIKAMGGKEGL